MVLEGEPGIGKTTVWQEGVQLAREPGWTVLTSRPAQSEAKLSFAGLSDLLAPVPPETFAELAALQRRALDVALLRAESTGPAPARRLLGTALLSLVRALAAERPVLLAIDDVQWLDRPSASVVEFALRRLVDEPVALLLATRPEGVDSGLVQALPQESVRRLPLRPLAAAALHRILAEQVGLRLPRPTLIRVAQASGGNPFYALEIARVLAAGGLPALGEALPVPDDLRLVVTKRIRSLPAETRAALLRAAAAARPDTRLVDASGLAPAEEAGLVRVAGDGRIEFTHPLFASAVYGSAPLARRREAHRALADVVADPEERARHLALASEGPDEAVAQEVEAAGRLARARGAPDSAAELVELAVRLTPAESSTADARRLALAEHLHVAGDFEHASLVLEELRSTLEPGDLRARALLLLADMAYHRRSADSEAAALVREAVASARDRFVLARCLAELGAWAWAVDGHEAVAASRAAVDALEQAPDADPGLMAFALASNIRNELYLGNGFDAAAARRALELEAASPPASVDDRVVYRLGQWLRFIDDLSGARRALVEAEQIARDEADDPSLFHILLNRMLVELWAGDWQLATELTGQLWELSAVLGAPEFPRAWQSYLDAYLGKLDAVRMSAAAAVRREPVEDMLHLRSLGVVELAAGEFAQADGHLAGAMRRLDEMGIDEPAIWRVEGEAIEAAVCFGDLERAEALLVRFERQAARTRIPWSLAVAGRCRGILLGARADLDGALAALEQAVASHERAPLPFERARTLLVLGQVYRRRKQRREARAALEEAMAVFEGLGAELWAKRAAGELARVPVRRAPADLTMTEETVAELAASGLTNREIAARAFLSAKTVEGTLARAYRKLGIHSRAELGRLMAERERSAKT
jgi:DNA-binding CsgD family transcriptional regulator